MKIEQVKSTVLSYFEALRDVSDMPTSRFDLHASLMPKYDAAQEARIDRAVAILIAEKKVERTSKGFYRLAGGQR